MKKTTIALMALALSLVLMLPTAGLAEVGNSGTIRKELSADTIGNITLQAQGLDVDIKLAGDEGTYAELDATVIGIHSADVSYDLEVTDQDDGVLIDAHHTGSDIGINRVKLHIFVPAESLDSLHLNLTDSDLTIDEAVFSSVEATLADSKLTARSVTFDSFTAETTKSDLNIEGHLSAIDLRATEGSAKLNSEILPGSVTINATDADVDLWVPETPEGFTLNYDITSGKLSTDYTDDFQEESGTITHGNGTSIFDIKMTNANLKVEKH